MAGFEVTLYGRVWVTPEVGAAELAAIRRADRLQNERFQITQQAAGAHQQSILRLMQLVKDPADSLKKRALQLSESILSFVYGRIQNAPKYERPTVPLSSLMVANPDAHARAHGELENRLKYEIETHNLYVVRFLTKVDDMSDELEAQGVTVDSLRQLNQGGSITTRNIQTIGQSIGGFAEEIQVSYKSLDT